ncbi:MAG: hypothetical protein L0Y54_24110, partial [Sporichthyaceae bacterium]|nr:hypothetical protein [Sporichthyaceae bacterium]
MPIPAEEALPSWAPPYLSTAELRSYERIDDDADDVELDDAIEAASRAVDLDCGRQFGRVPGLEQRFYTARYDRARGRWLVSMDDLMTTAGLDPRLQDADGVDLGAISSYTLEPRNAAAKNRPWELLVVGPASTRVPTGAESEVAITALWG